MTKPRGIFLAGLLIVALLAGAFLLVPRFFALTPRMAASLAAGNLADGRLAAAVWRDLSAGPDLPALTEPLAGYFEASPRVEVEEVVDGDNVASAALRWTWTPDPGRSGMPEWTYTSEVEFARQGGTWRATLSPDVVHPELDEGETLRVSETAAGRGSILGQDDEALVEDGPVVDVGVQPSRMGDSDEVFETLEDTLDIDAGELESRVREASPDQFVPVITLRRAEYERYQDTLQPLPGTVFREREQSLARTKDFAQATIGAAGTATAEEISASEGEIEEGDTVGRSGLQKDLDSQLRGERGIAVDVVSEEGDETVFDVEPTRGETVRTTLDAELQEIADGVVATSDKPAALVAMRPSDGHVLAVANFDPAGPSYDRALTGRYPPGSVYKVVTTLALLNDGTAPGDTIACPPTTTVDGKRFKNAEDKAAGDVPLSEDFAESCNTAFVDATRDLPSEDLADAARSLGMTPNDPGMEAFVADIPRPEGSVEHAASSIGQSTILASPLGVATMTSSVVRGTAVAPVIVPDLAERAPGEDPNPESIGDLRAMMLETVASGTASALASVPGEPIGGKTGTAEYGTDVPPRTHSWFTGYQGDLAVSVLVEDGGFGADAAVPLARDFFLEVQS